MGFVVYLGSLMEVGRRWNPRLELEDLRPDELAVLPIFRFKQPGGDSQDLLSQVQSLKDGGVKLHGHALISKREHPRVEYAKDFRAYIEGITAGYEGLIDSWDVCNEPAGYRYQLWGDDWPVKIFAIARELFPDAELWLNEYAVTNDAHWTQVMTLIEKLTAEGLIDGVGLQCNTDLRDRVPQVLNYGTEFILKVRPAFKLKRCISDVKAAGLRVALTEVSCVVDPGQENLASATIQGYEQVASEAEVDRITYW